MDSPFTKLLPNTTPIQFADALLNILLDIEAERERSAPYSANIWASCLMRMELGLTLAELDMTNRDVILDAALAEIIKENPIVIGVRGPGRKKKIDAWRIALAAKGDDLLVTVTLFPEAYSREGATETCAMFIQRLDERWPDPAETTTPVVAKRKQSSATNKWLCEEHLDRGIPLRELEAEWLQKRRHEGLKDDPLDPNDSMKKVIKAEKQRRAKAGGSLGDQ